MYYLQHEWLCCIGYTISSRRWEFVYLIQHRRECCKWLKKRLILWVHWRSNFKNKCRLSRENQSLCKVKVYVNQHESVSHIQIRHAYDFSLCFLHELLMSFLNIYINSVKVWMFVSLLWVSQFTWSSGHWQIFNSYSTNSSRIWADSRWGA
jgi:hypothetical protein